MTPVPLPNRSNVASEAEREAFNRLVADRETLIRDEFDMRLALLRKEEAEKKKADEERIAEMKKRMEKEMLMMEQAKRLVPHDLHASTLHRIEIV